MMSFLVLLKKQFASCYPYYGLLLVLPGIAVDWILKWTLFVTLLSTIVYITLGGTKATLGKSNLPLQPLHCQHPDSDTKLTYFKFQIGF